MALMSRGLYSLDGDKVAGKIVAASRSDKRSNANVENAAEQLAGRYSTLDGGTVSAGVAAVAKAENEDEIRVANQAVNAAQAAEHDKKYRVAFVSYRRAAEVYIRALGKEKDSGRRSQLQRQVDATLKCAELLKHFAPPATGASIVQTPKVQAYAGDGLSYQEALARGRELDDRREYTLAIQYYKSGVGKLLQIASGSRLSERDRRSAREAAAQYLTRIETLMKIDGGAPVATASDIPVAVAHEILPDHVKN